MSELAYSLHLGSDKNRKNISKQNGKNNLSGTTSLPNNAIQNVRQLSKVDKHNYRKYDNEQELIEIVRGTSSPLDDVKELYISEFDEARLEYNSKQTRPSSPGERKLVVGYDLLVKQCLLAPQLDSCRFHFCLCRADIGLRRAYDCVFKSNCV